MENKHQNRRLNVRCAARLLAGLLLVLLWVLPAAADGGDTLTISVLEISESGEGKDIEVSCDNPTDSKYSFGWVYSGEIQVTTTDGTYSENISSMEYPILRGNSIHTFHVEPCPGQVLRVVFTDLRVLDGRGLPSWTGIDLTAYDAGELALEVPTTDEVAEDLVPAEEQAAALDNGKEQAEETDASSALETQTSVQDKTEFEGIVQRVIKNIPIVPVRGVFGLILILTWFAVILLGIFAFWCQLFRGLFHREQISKDAKSAAGDRGEAEVDHCLSWWVRKHPEYKVIAKDCVSKYKNGCILLRTPSSHEVQEIDHLLVGPAGVIAIETKNYGGIICVEDNETWVRQRRGQSDRERMESPSAQVERHELLLRSIVGRNVPLHSLICIANDQTEVKGDERSEYPIILRRYLSKYLDRVTGEAPTLSAEQTEALVHRIECAKVRPAASPGAKDARKKCGQQQQAMEQIMWQQIMEQQMQATRQAVEQQQLMEQQMQAAQQAAEFTRLSGIPMNEGGYLPPDPPSFPPAGF